MTMILLCACRNFWMGKFMEYAKSCGSIQSANTPTTFAMDAVSPINLGNWQASTYKKLRRSAMALRITHDLCIKTPSISNFLAPNACPPSVSSAFPFQAASLQNICNYFDSFYLDFVSRKQ
ncbi:uncharacterized protein DS421_5g146810 [Arachis hypogaea]|nr:uncharacterized protein DS421_5g146810 [Arachis hypogaea]